MTIIESRPSQLVRMKLEFLKPFQVTNTAEFAFEERGDQTKVTWSMFGKSRFMCKAMGAFYEHGQNDRCPIRRRSRKSKIDFRRQRPNPGVCALTAPQTTSEKAHL